MSNGRRIALGVALTVAWLGAASPSGADWIDIEIVNPGFEDPVLADDGFSGGAIPGWSLSVTGTLALDDPSWGVWNPPDLAEGLIWDGDNVALIFLPDRVGEGEVVLSQTTPVTLEAGVRYDLVAQVGDLSPEFDPVYEGFPGARIEFAAGETVLASDEPWLVGDGTYWYIDLSYVVPADHPQVGEPLVIRLVDANESAGGGVTWDGVQLWAIPVEVYRFSIDTQDGSLAGLFSYIPSEGLVGASIPYEATLEITEASGVFAFFGALDWGDDGGVTAYEEEGQFYVSIGAPTNAGYIEIAIDEEFDLGGPLPVAALSAEKTRVYGGGELIFSGSEPGASVTLTYAPEPGAAAGAGVALAVLAASARARRRA